MANLGYISLKKPMISRTIFIMTAIFLLLPLFILVLYSFNDGKNTWTHLSLRWYKILFERKPQLWIAFRHSLVVALVSGIMATAIGTLMAIGLNWYKFRIKSYLFGMIFLALILPDIIVGLSLAILFSSLKLNLGLMNLILAHISFNIPFVTLIVLARLDEFDNSILEVSNDLGANEWQKLTKVILPIAAPGIVSALITAITLSLEDFVITVFVGTVGSTTLPVAINNAIRKDPDSNVVYALSVIMISGTVLIAVSARKFLKYLVKR
ncbi:MAG: ABC transporter permease [Spirochaetia bacterium]